jgi:hypothetical protein
MTVTGKKGRPKGSKNKKPELTKVTPKKRMPASTEDEIEEALRASGGFISRAAKRLGKDHSAVSKRIKKSKRLQEVLQEIVESQLDKAEDALLGLIEEKSLGACCFYLKTKGQGRGYIEKKQISFAGVQICISGQAAPDQPQIAHDLSQEDYTIEEEEELAAQIAD